MGYTHERCQYQQDKNGNTADQTRVLGRRGSFPWISFVFWIVMVAIMTIGVIAAAV